MSQVRDDKSELKILYRRFIKEYISKLFDFDIMFEKEPFFRIHQENNTSLIKYHTDSDYLVPDGCHDMFRHEINFWMPVTKAYDTNSLWVESSPKKKDYSPINAEYGDIIQFDGPNLLHGTEINKTGQTRVSLDFRVVPKNIFSGEGHINPADYYDEIWGCTAPDAQNFMPEATMDDGSCTWSDNHGGGGGPPVQNELLPGG